MKTTFTSGKNNLRLHHARKLLSRLSIFAALTCGGVQARAQTFTGPSSSATPYVLPVSSGGTATSVISVPDINAGYKMCGIPDGLGAFDNGDGTFTLLMNHELTNTSGINRAHGSKGAFVSKWIINKSTLAVVSGGDLMQNVNLYNTATQTYTTYNAGNPSTLAIFGRFCSADLPPVSAFFNSTTGLGTQERIFMNGEETNDESRAMAHIVTGSNAGTSWELPALGKAAWENSVACPVQGDKTIVGETNDGTDGQVYIYIGTKTNTGTEIDKAGLTNGRPYGVKVTGFPIERVNTSTINPPPSAGTHFDLVDLGNVMNITGASFNTISNSNAVTKFSRPEDGAWDPSHPNDFYFVTTDQLDQVSDGVGAQVGRTRLWKLHFSDITNPELGGNIEAVLTGTEGLNMLDNMAIDHYGHILLQEDVGNAAHNGKIWQYTIATDSLKLIFKHDPARFGDIGISATAPFNMDEETSGIIDVQDILGAGMFLTSDQAHYAIAGEATEGGQLLALFNADTHLSACATTSSTSVTACDSYVWNGSTYTSSGTYTYHTSNSSGCDSTATLLLTINQLPVVTADNVSGCAGTSITLTATPAGGSFSVANPYVGSTTTYTYTYTDGNGCSNTSAPANILVNPLPTVTLSGLAGTYYNTSPQATLTVTPAGGTISGPGISGNTFDPSVAGVGGPYNITYTYTDANGCTNSVAHQTSVLNCVLPTQPGSISMSGGATRVCPGDTRIYTVAMVAGVTFQWTVPTGAVINSGQGTRSINVTYNAGFTASGTISVVKINSCGGTSIPRSLTISRNTPATPSAISGTALACSNSSHLYSVTNVAGMTYNWSSTVPSITISSGQGTNSVGADFSSAFTTGSLVVNASNGCGTGPNRTLAIKSTPSIPGSIAGPAYGTCAQTAVSYSVPDVTGVVFNWSVPAGATIVSGQGTHAITVDFTGSVASGSVQVTTSNSCGNSPVRSLTVKTIPATPGTISHPSCVFPFSTGNAFSIAAVPFATSYTWTGPSGSHISDGVTTSPSNVLTTTSTSVTVNFGVVTSSSKLTAKANNACGSSPTKNLALVPCPVRLVGSSSPAEQNVMIYPNPTTGIVNVDFTSDKSEEYELTITNITGAIVFESKMPGQPGENQTNINLEFLTKGIYFLQLTSSTAHHTQKLILQ